MALTTAHDRGVYAVALPVLPMDTIHLVEDDVSPPAWESKKQRGRPKGKRFSCAIDGVNAPLRIPTTQRNDGGKVCQMTQDAVETESISTGSTVTGDRIAQESVIPADESENVGVPVGSKRMYKCSTCGTVGHNKRNCSKPRV